MNGIARTQTLLFGTLLVGLLVVSATPSVSHAQDESDIERAASLGEQATEAYAEGDVVGAISLLEEAFSIVPDPNYAFNLGAMYDETGNLASAHYYFQRYIEVFPGAPDRADVEDYLASVREQVEREYALLEATSRPAGAEVYRLEGDRQIRLGETPLERYVRPGELRLEFRRDGYETATSARNAIAGVRLSLDVTMTRLPQPTPEPEPDPTAPAQDASTVVDETPPPPSETSPTGWIVLGSGGALMATGAVFWILSGSSASDRDALVARIGTDDPPELAEIRDLEDQSETQALIGNISFAAGAVAAGVGTWLVIRDRRSGESVSGLDISPLVGNGWGLSLGGRF